MPKFVLLTWVDPEDAAAWEAMTPAEQEADVERHRTWFRRFGDRVVGGEELDLPTHVKTLRPGRQGEGVVMTDGPYVETKEILGGFVIIEADDIDQAVAIAGEWPSLASQANPTVQVHPVYVRD